MTTITISYGFLDLQAEIEDSFKDQYHPILGHYTIPDHVAIVGVYHNGEDIYDLLSESVLDDIMKAYDAQCKAGEEP